MTVDQWAALEANPRVTLSATGSWLESDEAKGDVS